MEEGLAAGRSGRLRSAEFVSEPDNPGKDDNSESSSTVSPPTIAPPMAIAVVGAPALLFRRQRRQQI